jgi:hypothetical protein
MVGRRWGLGMGDEMKKVGRWGVSLPTCMLECTVVLEVVSGMCDDILLEAGIASRGHTDAQLACEIVGGQVAGVQ